MTNNVVSQDEIIEMAEQAGFTPVETSWHFSTIEAFAKLVEERTAAKEREACVVDIQMHIPRSGRDTIEYKMAMRMIERIRARGRV